MTRNDDTVGPGLRPRPPGHRDHGDLGGDPGTVLSTEGQEPALVVRSGIGLCPENTSSGRYWVRTGGLCRVKNATLSAKTLCHGGRPRQPQRSQPAQSTATSSAADTSSIRSPLSTPSRSTRTPTETLSTVSRLTAVVRVTGSSPGSRITSLGSVLIVVVHGAASVRPNRGIAASLESTTTGRRPISGSSHHHSSPRRGERLTSPRPHPETTPDLPIRQAGREADRRRPHRRRRSHRHDAEPTEPEAPHREQPHLSRPLGSAEPRKACPHQPSYSPVLVPWHNYATFVPLQQPRSRAPAPRKLTDSRPEAGQRGVRPGGVGESGVVTRPRSLRRITLLRHADSGSRQREALCLTRGITQSAILGSSLWPLPCEGTRPLRAITVFAGILTATLPAELTAGDHR